jgi:hypothetical protein
VPQRANVIGADDSEDDGDQAHSIAATVASTDAVYAALHIDAVSVTNIDDDTAGIRVTPTEGVMTSEGGATAAVTLVLDSAPAADVTIALSSSHETEGTVDHDEVVFTTANWNVPRVVTLRGIDDSRDDGDRSYSLVTGAAASADPNYHGLDAADVRATNVDNDTAGIAVTPTEGLVTSDTGQTAAFTVVLTSEPVADVSIALTSSDATEGTVSVAVVTFDASNWNTAQSVTVTGIDDGAWSDSAYLVLTAAAASTDPQYGGLDAADVAVTNVHDGNDPPVWSLPSGQNGEEDTRKRFGSAAGNRLWLVDPDAGSGALRVTITPSSGTFSLSTGNGLTFSAGDGVDDPVMMFAGSLSAVNAALEGASYMPALNQVGEVIIQFAADDQGASGLGGPRTATSVMTVQIVEVNDPPTISDVSDQTVAQGQTLGPVTFSIADLESDAGTLNVTATAMNQLLFPTGTLVVGGSGPQRTLALSPAAGRTGTTVITLTVSDGQAVASDTFRVIVEASTSTITGTVTSYAGTLAGIVVELSGTMVRSTTTDGAGAYRFDALPTGVSYAVRVADSRYRFTPASHVIPALAGDHLADFRAVRSVAVRGRVSDLNGGAVPDVLVTLSGDQSGTTVTDADGRYVFDVAEGGTYTLTPSKAGFVFAAPALALGSFAADTIADFTVTSGTFTRYFAEGATGGFFDTTFALLNATIAPAVVNMHFERADGVTVSKTVDVPARSRATVHPESWPGLEATEFSTVIEANVPVSADRTMTWDATGYGSHAESAIARPQPVWYLAEGATIGGFDLFYLLHNPNAQPATVDVRYLLPAPQPAIVKRYSVPAHTRLTIWVNREDPVLAAAEVSAVVTAVNGVPIIVERAMYLNRPGMVFDAGHEGAGIPEPATTWFLAEGATGPIFDTFVLIANPSGADALVEANYLLPDGSTVTKQYTVRGGSRFNVWVDGEDPRLASTSVSTLLTSLNGVPIVVERAMWWSGPGGQWQEGHDSAGATRSGTKWTLADGESGGPRHTDTFVLVANTSNIAGEIDVTVIREDGTELVGRYTLGPRSRSTISVGTDFPDAVNHRYGVVVQSVGTAPVEIVVERAMYSDAVDALGNRTTWAAGTSALGTRIH